MKRNFLVITALMLLALMVFSCGGKSENASAQAAEDTTVYEWRLSSTNPEGTPLAKFLDGYLADIADATGGRIKVTAFHGNSLGSPMDLVGMAKDGGLEMLNMGVAQAMGEFPVCDIVQIPFLVQNPTTAAEVVYKLYHDGYLTEFEGEGLKVMFFMPTDMQMIALVDKKITNVEDFVGMKIRANSGSIISAIEALGASPVSITTTEVYMSLERKVIDGAISSPGAMRAFKFFEPSKYLCTMPIATGLNYVVVNMDKWNELPADLQVKMMEVSQKAYYEYMRIVDWEERSAMESMAKGGMEPYNLSAVEQAKVKEKTAYLVDEYINTVTELGYDGKAIVDTAMEVVARCEAHLK